MAERVRAYDWRPGGPGFESHWRNIASEFPKFHLPVIIVCQCLSEETLKAVGPFYLVFMPEVKYPTKAVNVSHVVDYTTLREGQL